MALNSFQPVLPQQPSLPTLPQDAGLTFCNSQTITATGYLNNANTNLSIGGGRAALAAAVNITAESGTSPFFQFHIFGSNDPAFGNGNVEDLFEFDYAPNTAQRLVPTIIGGSLAVPDANRAGTLIIKPFWNLGAGQIFYSFLRMYVVIGGTTPSITCSAWAAPCELNWG